MVPCLAGWGCPIDEEPPMLSRMRGNLAALSCGSQASMGMD